MKLEFCYHPYLMEDEICDLPMDKMLVRNKGRT